MQTSAKRTTRCPIKKLIDHCLHSVFTKAHCHWAWALPLVIAVNKINRGDSICTKQNNSSKRLVIVVIINQNKVHVCPTIIIRLSLCSRWSQIKKSQLQVQDRLRIWKADTDVNSTKHANIVISNEPFQHIY